MRLYALLLELVKCWFWFWHPRIASRRDSSARLGLAYRSVQPPDKMSANAVRPAVFHFYFRAVLTFFSTINNASLRRLLTILFNRKLHSNFS